MAEMSDQETLAAYVELAGIAQQSLALVRDRDWESLAAQQAGEAELLARLQSLAQPLCHDAGMRSSYTRYSPRMNKPTPCCGHGAMTLAPNCSAWTPAKGWRAPTSRSPAVSEPRQFAAF
jgi:hypothetical protein